MEGKETYRFATRTLATTALTSIEKAGLKPSDIDLFIPHQANIRIIEAVAKGLDLPMERCSSTSTSTATRPRRPCRSPWPRRSTRAASRSATGSSSSPSGPASPRVP
jgi:hypothetical protein